MTSKLIETIEIHFGNIDDPRYHHSPPHLLVDIITIALCALISGANDWEAVAAFGRAKESWLRTFLRLPNGIPSADTFERVFAQIDPEQFQASFIHWVAAISHLTAGEVVAVDGKTLCGSVDRSNDRKAIHLVSAWASQNHLVLGQVKVDDKSNEITAIPELLRLLTLPGCIVTIDAMGCQTEIAAQIVAQGADYVLALKENQGHLYREVARLFKDALTEPRRGIPFETAHTIEKGHGRIEKRQVWTISHPDYLKYLDPTGRWTGLESVVRVDSQRQFNHHHSQESRYYISSLAGEPTVLNTVVRTHWTIENQLHWVLDVAFREDDSRVRRGYAPENLAVLRHMALNLLKQEHTSKLSIQNKRLRAAWDNDYLLQILCLLT
ncbi:MAG: ISAs1 family transposase [Anaerolineae bacterium]|nr:ISAs1 family transposase [Anaerolineae bacterium]